MNNDCNLNLLNEVYKSTSMSINSIDKLENYVENDKFLQLIRSQKREYIKFQNSAMTQIREYGKEPQNPNIFAKISAEIGTKAETFLDNSASNIAKMMIDGNNMGITALKKELNLNNCADDSVKRFCNGLIATEQNSVDNLTAYL